MDNFLGLEVDQVKQNRHLYIGGSDIARVTSPTMAMTVARDKINPPEQFESIYTEFGNIAESLILSFVNESTASNYIEDQTYFEERKAPLLSLRGNLDGDEKEQKVVLEIKTLSEHIIEDGGNELKKKIEYYTTQNGFYQRLSKYTEGIVAIVPRPEVLLDKAFSDWSVKEMRERQTEIEEVIMGELMEKIEYINVNMTPKLAQEIDNRIKLVDQAYEKLCQKGDNEEHTIDVKELLIEYKDLSDEEAEIKTRKEEIIKDISEKLTEADEIQLDDVVARYTPARKSSRNSFDSKAFQKDKPALYERYMKVSEVNNKASIKFK